MSQTLVLILFNFKKKRTHMRLHELIFSTKTTHRILRHLLFWAVFFIYCYYVNLFPRKPEDLTDIKTYEDALTLMIFTPISILSVYTALYFLLPRYILRSRYLRLSIAAILLTVFYFFIAWTLNYLLVSITQAKPFNQLPLSDRWFNPIRYGIGLPLTSATITTIIKMLKTWYLQQKENDRLLRQKTRNEIQLMKTQFQPQFLHSTLQDILLLNRKQPSLVPSSVIKLSDLLSYLLYDIEKEKVPLEDELQMVRNYLSLKKIFYNDRLLIRYKQDGELSEKEIAPLLFVSVIGDFFEKLIDPVNRTCLHTININFKAESNEIFLQIEHISEQEGTAYKYETDKFAEESLQRIQLLYPESHHLETYSENGTTGIMLSLETKLTTRRREEIQHVNQVDYEPA